MQAIEPTDSQAEACIGIARPISGTVTAFFCYWVANTILGFMTYEPHEMLMAKKVSSLRTACSLNAVSGANELTCYDPRRSAISKSVAAEFPALPGSISRLRSSIKTTKTTGLVASYLSLKLLWPSGRNATPRSTARYWGGTLSLVVFGFVATIASALAQDKRPIVYIAPIEGERVDVISDGDLINANETIEVTRVDGNRIVVRQVTNTNEKE